MVWGVIFLRGEIGGGFWPFLAGKRAVSDSEHLATLRKSVLVNVALKRQSGYFGFPCGAKKFLGRVEKS